MKRFTDTEIWYKPWFRKLPPHVKELWRWLCDHCDHAGVIDPDLEAASFFIGETVTAEDLTRFNGNIEPFKGKWRIPDFIPFQYGKLSSLCKPHKPVFEALERHGIGIEYPIEGFQVATRKLQEKEKDKEKEKVQEEGGVGGETQSANFAERPSLEEVQFHASKIGLAPWRAEDWWNEMEGCGWLDYSKRPIVKWQSWLARVKAKWEADGRPTGPPTRNGNGKLSWQERIDLKERRDRLIDDIKYAAEKDRPPIQKEISKIEQQLHA